MLIFLKCIRKAIYWKIFNHFFPLRPEKKKKSRFLDKFKSTNRNSLTSFFFLFFFYDFKIVTYLINIRCWNYWNLLRFSACWLFFNIRRLWKYFITQTLLSNFFSFIRSESDQDNIFIKCYQTGQIVGLLLRQFFICTSS